MRRSASRCARRRKRHRCRPSRAGGRHCVVLIGCVTDSRGSLATLRAPVVDCHRRIRFGGCGFRHSSPGPLAACCPASHSWPVQPSWPRCSRPRRPPSVRSWAAVPSDSPTRWFRLAPYLVCPAATPWCGKDVRCLSRDPKPPPHRCGTRRKLAVQQSSVVRWLASVSCLLRQPRHLPLRPDLGTCLDSPPTLQPQGPSHAASPWHPALCLLRCLRGHPHAALGWLDEHSSRRTGEGFPVTCDEPAVPRIDLRVRARGLPARPARFGNQDRPGRRRATFARPSQCDQAPCRDHPILSTPPM